MSDQQEMANVPSSNFKLETQFDILLSLQIKFKSHINWNNYCNEKVENKMATIMTQIYSQSESLYAIQCMEYKYKTYKI